jgi:hypothetical protein
MFRWYLLNVYPLHVVLPCSDEVLNVAKQAKVSKITSRLGQKYLF